MSFKGLSPPNPQKTLNPWLGQPSLEDKTNDRSASFSPSCQTKATYLAPHTRPPPPTPNTRSLLMPNISIYSAPHPPTPSPPHRQKKRACPSPQKSKQIKPKPTPNPKHPKHPPPPLPNQQIKNKQATYFSTKQEQTQPKSPPTNKNQPSC